MNKEDNKVKCAIFDFNGTLFYDYNENKDAWNMVAKRIRGSEFGEEEYLSMMGKTDRRCAEYIVPEASDEELDRISEEKEEIYLRLCVERKINIEKDALLFIEELKRRGVRVMIASSAPKMNMDWYIENLDLGRYFDIPDIVAGRNDIPSKPAPDIYIYTQKLGGFAGSECIAFEDAPGGLKSALRAG
ncbi:MAG: HAD family hydrolase, partial [Candidatus Ornithospirochaeta sp.]